MAESQVGKSILRQDAVSKVTGQAAYPGDFDMDGALWMKIRFSDRVHARVVSIDTSRAEAHPGVIAVFTARDVPCNEYGLVIPDQPVLCGPGSRKAGADRVRCLADYVAVVVAETEEAAAVGRDLIDVVYEDLPIVTDAEEAIKDSAPLLHDWSSNNVLCHFRIRKGDMAAGWSQAELVVESTYTTSWQEHAYLQPEAGLSYIDEQGRVAVIVAGQWVHEDQEQIAHALNLPHEQVRVIYPAIGGAFGGREDMSVQIILALATWKLRRPVKIIWSREESIRGHHKRHPVTIHTRWGATHDGKIVAAEGTVYGDGGAYAYTTPKVMGNAQLLATGPYTIDNIHLDTYGMYTNNIPSGAFRGFGGPQGLFAAEGQMNKLAELLAIDPVEIRMRNIVHEGDILSVGTPLPRGVTIPAVVEKCAEESGHWEKSDEGWKRTPLEQPTDLTKRRGGGFALGFKNVGFSFGFPEQSWATIELHGSAEIEEVVVRHSGAEV